MFSLQQNWRVEQVLPGRGGWRRGGKTMYTHVSKCKNDKIKGERTLPPKQEKYTIK
jgi:hypothetical protein